MRARLDMKRVSQRGFFLIEAMVAILIFALGVLGLVAMGGTAVASQSDAQYRTEASNYANAIASEIAIAVDRTSDDTIRTSLAAFAHQANPPPTTVPQPCVFNGASIGAGPIKNLLDRAAAATTGLPGETAVNQQIFIENTVGDHNRVHVTLCWKTAADNVMRRHTLVSYIN